MERTLHDGIFFPLQIFQPMVAQLSNDDCHAVLSSVKIFFDMLSYDGVFERQKVTKWSQF
jgi:hypothetical protein